MGDLTREWIPSVSIPEGTKGEYRIVKRELKPDITQSLRMARDGRTYVPGTYTYLFRGDVLMMSDTPDEKKDHVNPVIKAKENCLLAGLGIGMVLNAIALKSEVTHIDVVEISQDVIDLVGPYYDQLYPGRITFHCASIFDWKWDKYTYYEIAWFDIWDSLDYEIHLPEMAKLHRRFGKRAKWKGSWGKEILLRQRRADKRNPWY